MQDAHLLLHTFDLELSFVLVRVARLLVTGPFSLVQ